MDPILDIWSIRPDLFTYSLRAPGQPARLFDDCFGTADFCLHDAAQALSNYFERVELHAAGQPVGIFALERMRCQHQRQLILAQLRAHLSDSGALSYWASPAHAMPAAHAYLNLQTM